MNFYFDDLITNKDKKKHVIKTLNLNYGYEGYTFFKNFRMILFFFREDFLDLPLKSHSVTNDLTNRGLFNRALCPLDH